MANTELTNYIVASRANGMVDSVIKETLRKQGWQDTDITEAFSAVPAGTLKKASMAKPNNALPFLVALVVLLAAVGGGYWYMKNHPKATTTTTAVATPFSDTTYLSLGTNEKFIQGTVTLADATACKDPRVFTETDSSYDPSSKTSKGRSIDSSGHFKTVGLSDAPTSVEVWDGTVDHTKGTMCLSALYNPASTAPFVINADTTAQAYIAGNITSNVSMAKLQARPSYTAYSAWLSTELKTHSLTAIEADATLNAQLIQLSTATVADSANAVAAAQ